MRKSLIIFIVLILVFSFVIFYLNKAVFPTKIKAAIITGLEGATGKKVLLGSARFSIFKGLILKDLIIRDDANAIINVKKAYCNILVLPVFSKQIIISRLIFESPDIFIERRADGSVNILELFPKESPAKSDFKLFVRRISIKNAAVNFHDLTLDPLYAKEISALDAEAYFLLPAKVKFSSRFDIPSGALIKVNISGEYSIGAKELSSEIRVKDLFPNEFARYYEKSGLSFPEGRFDTDINLKYKGSILSAETESDTKGLAVSAGSISAMIDGSMRSTMRYDFAGKSLDYIGSVNIRDMDMDGIDYIDSIDDIKGRVEFSNLGITSDNITAIVLDMPVEARLKVADLKNAVVEIDAASDIGLAFFQGMLKEDFKLDIPADIEGAGKLQISIQYPVAAPDTTRLNGSIYMLNAIAKINNGKDALEGLTGRVRFLPNQVSWDDISFRYHDVHYTSSGILTDFKAPGIQLKLSSKDISLDTVFALNGKTLNFSKFSGKYLNSGIAAAGLLDMSDPARPAADIKGTLNVNLEDLRKPLEKFKDKFERIKPKGFIRVEFALNGNPKDLKACAIDANLSSENLSLYGLKLTNSTMNYAQKDGTGDILFLRSFLYGGSMAATGKIGWASKDVPYGLAINIDGVKIEKFKADTGFKDKDISGSIKMQAKMKGIFADASRLYGEGQIAVTEGMLWQLNLFRGLGVLLFTSDFSNIIFKEGRCDFTIADKAIYTDNLALRSGLVDIYGPVKIGFDNSVSAEFKAEFLDQTLRSEAGRNIAAALGRYTIVEVAGTLKEPQYKVKPDVANIVESIAERFMEE